MTTIHDRIREARVAAGRTLTDIAPVIGVSVSTLSRLESGERRPTVDLLLALADEYGVTLDDLARGPRTPDPRVPERPTVRGGRVYTPLTRRGGTIQAYKLGIPPEHGDAIQRVHDGHEWLYVLAGSLRLLLGEREYTMQPGEVVEFDTRTPHWFGSATDSPVELLSLFGPQGERVHVIGD